MSNYVLFRIKQSCEAKKIFGVIFGLIKTWQISGQICEKNHLYDFPEKSFAKVARFRKISQVTYI